MLGTTPQDFAAANRNKFAVEVLERLRVNSDEHRAAMNAQQKQMNKETAQ